MNPIEHQPEGLRTHGSPFYNSCSDVDRAQTHLFQNTLFLSGVLGLGCKRYPWLSLGESSHHQDLHGLLSGQTAMNWLQACQRDVSLQPLLHIHRDQRLWVHERTDMASLRNNVHSPLHQTLNRSLDFIVPAMPMALVGPMNRSYMGGHRLRLALAASDVPIGCVTWEMRETIHREGPKYEAHADFLRSVTEKTWHARLLARLPGAWVLVEENKKGGQTARPAHRLSIFDHENDVVHSQVLPPNALAAGLLTILCLPTPVTPFPVRSAMRTYLKTRCPVTEGAWSLRGIMDGILRLPHVQRNTFVRDVGGWFAVSSDHRLVHLEPLLMETRHSFLTDDEQTMPQGLSPHGQTTYSS